MSIHERVLLKLVVVFLFTISPNLFADTEVGRLALVNGKVLVTKSEASKSEKPAAPNDPVFNNDIIKTGEGSAAKLLFSDQSIIDLGPNSSFQISNYALKDGESRTGTFSLLYGKVRALVTKKVGPGGKVEVRAGQTVMGVRGTEFMVDSPKPDPGVAPPATTLVVLAGEVAVTPPNGGPPVSIGAGQMMTAPAGNSPGGGSASPGSTAASGGSSGDQKSDKGDSASGGPSQTAQSGKGPGGADKGGGNVQVASIGTAQAQSMMSEMKPADNTFMSSVSLSQSGGQQGPQSGSMAMLGTMIAGSGALPPPPSEGGRLPPPPNMANFNFLPPVNIIPGNKVTLTVIIQ